MLAHVMIIIFGASSVAFLIRFELAMARELRRTPKQWKFVSRLRIEEQRLDSNPRIIAFPQVIEHSRKQASKAGM